MTYQGDYGVSAGISAAASIYMQHEAKKFQKKMLKKQLAYQREFAQNGIQWRVADAKAAGIHPLAALGAQTMSYEPQYVGDAGESSAMAAAENLGQAVGGAFEGWLNRKAQKEQVRALELDNDIRQKRKEILEQELVNMGQLLDTDQFGVVQGDGQGTSAQRPGGGVTHTPAQVVVSREQGMRAGDEPGETTYLVPTLEGPVALQAPSQPLSEPVESSWVTQLQYGAIKGIDKVKALYYYEIPWGEAGKVHRNKLRKYRDTILEKPRKGHFWAYEARLGHFIQLDASKERPRLYKVNPWRKVYGYDFEK